MWLYLEDTCCKPLNDACRMLSVAIFEGYGWLNRKLLGHTVPSVATTAVDLQRSVCMQHVGPDLVHEKEGTLSACCCCLQWHWGTPLHVMLTHDF